MGLVLVPLLPYVLSSIHPRDAGSASGIANAVQQVGSDLGIAVIGAVFFGQLSAVASYGHAFAAAAAVQVALLAAAATLFLPAGSRPMPTRSSNDTRRLATMSELRSWHRRPG